MEQTSDHAASREFALALIRRGVRPRHEPLPASAPDVVSEDSSNRLARIVGDLIARSPEDRAATAGV